MSNRAVSRLTCRLTSIRGGLNPFSDVVTAQLNLLENTNSLVTAQGDALAALISLYSALGGGWDVDMMNEK